MNYNNFNNNDLSLRRELINHEPLHPDERQRNDYEPTGLKNIGNSKPLFILILIIIYSLLFQFIDPILFLHTRILNKNSLKLFHSIGLSFY